MQLAIFFYFLKIKDRTWPDSFTFSAAFVLIAAAFDSNGGLSDFRMDLLQYLLFATVLATYLITRRRQALVWWALLGLTSGLLCLGRATSPVYIAPIFGVCSAVDLIANRQNYRQSPAQLAPSRCCRRYGGGLVLRQQLSSSLFLLCRLEPGRQRASLALRKY